MTNSYISTTLETNALDVDAFDMTGSNDTLFLASTGSLVALGSGSNGLTMMLADETATLDGTVYSAMGEGVREEGTINSTIIVNGEVISAIDSGIVASGAQDRIVINGSVEGGGTDGISLAGQYSSIDVKGLVEGTSAGIYASGQGQIIRVSGSVDSSTVGSGTGIKIFNQQQTVDIAAKGEVYGADIGVLSESTNATVRNDGHISGATGLFADASSDLSVINTGSISNISVDNSTNTSILNSGVISPGSGSVAFYLVTNSTGTMIANSGAVHGDLNVDGTSTVIVQNSGNWNGQLAIESSGNSVTNTGTISHGIAFGNDTNSTSGNSITNNGTIHGGIAFVTAAGTAGSDTLVNAGTIYGGVAMSVTDTVINTGTIHGSVTFSAAGAAGSNDIFDNSNGIVLGVIGGGTGNDTFIVGQGSNAYNPSGASDHFDFNAAFGHDIINGFKVGGGHDVIAFSGGDFTSFAELQTHMTQVGANTIITLDAGSTIELTHTTIAHLVAADFLFG